jgi:hypothetical protein
VATPTDIPCPDGLAGSATDLYVTSCGGIYRIRGVNGASPIIQFFSNPGVSLPPTHAITISRDGVIFATAGNQVWLIGNVSDPGPDPGAALATFPGTAQGVAVISPLNGSGVPVWRFVFVASSDGSVTVFDQLGVITKHVIVNGGTSGDHSVLGPDGCLYVPQGAAIARIANANGTCDLVGALAATPTITLSGGGGILHVNATPVSVNAALANVPTGTAVTFTVTGVNGRSTTVLPTGPNATYSYTGTNTGDDVITASVVVGGTTFTSNAITVHWRPPVDTTPPLVSFTVTGGGPNVTCPNSGLAMPPVVSYCGWYATPPTVHWTFSDPESGILSTNACEDFILVADTPATGLPVACTVTNGDGLGITRTVVLQALTTPPSISASLTVGGSPYGGALTNQPVTVTFACTHPAGAFAIQSCTSPITISSGDGSAQTRTGTAVTLSGLSTSITSAAILIDTVLPTITAQVTVGIVAYDGSWTRGPVLVHFICADNVAVASCTPDVTLTADQNATRTGTVLDTAGNTASVTTVPIKIDRTPPVTTATLTGSLSGGAYVLSATVGLAATDAASGVATITYRVEGGALVTVSGASASFVVNTGGSHTVTYHATDVAGNVEVDKTVTFTVVVRVRTVLAITSSPSVATGSKVSAKLTTDIGAPLGGQTVRFTAGAVTKTAVTNAAGTASVDLGLAPGAYTLTASFAGTSAYLPSDATQRIVVSTSCGDDNRNNGDSRAKGNTDRNNDNQCGPNQDGKDNKGSDRR